MKPGKAARLLEEAMARHRQGDLAAAEHNYREILRRRPDDADAHYNLGNLLVQKQRLEEAERHFRMAFTLQPQSAPAAGNLGGALLRLERYDEAETYLRRALELDPGQTAARLNRAAIMEVRGRFDETIALYDEALRQNPSDAEVHNLKALALLVRGQFADGWIEYRWRVQRLRGRGFYGQFSFPYWNGESLAGRQILVWGEQGPGDEILAASLLREVADQAARVVLVCSPRMDPVLRRAFPNVDILAADGKPKDHAAMANIDFQASMAELGQWLRPSSAAFARQAPFLAADPHRTATLREKYRKTHPANRLVGVSWRSKRVDLEREKSIPLDAWEDILRTPGITFVNLQYGDCEDELRAFQSRSGIALLSDAEVDPLRDLDAFTSQVAAMDLVISASNTTVHFAGGLGRPTWTFVPANRGRLWYWGLTGDNALWYPSMRLFRQTAAPRWDDTLARAASALRAWRGDAPAT